MWGAVAPGWEQNADFVDSRTEGLTRTMLEAAALEPGDRVLELACGPGGLGIAAAERVGAEGEVVLSDVVPQMTDDRRDEGRGPRARQRDHARARSRADRSARRAATTPCSAARGSCWCPITRALRRARSGACCARVGEPSSRSGARASRTRGWARCSTPSAPSSAGRSRRRACLARSRSTAATSSWPCSRAPGSTTSRSTEVDAPWIGASFDQWWLVTSALAGPLAKVLEAQPPEAIEAIRSHAREALSAVRDRRRTRDPRDDPGRNRSARLAPGGREWPPAPPG